jgi:hypothetical protein
VRRARGSLGKRLIATKVSNLWYGSAPGRLGDAMWTTGSKPGRVLLFHLYAHAVSWLVGLSILPNPAITNACLMDSSGRALFSPVPHNRPVGSPRMNYWTGPCSSRRAAGPGHDRTTVHGRTDRAPQWL